MNTSQLIYEQYFKIKLSNGIIPWRKSWDNKVGKPRSYIHNVSYRGVNSILLGGMNRDCPYWITFKECSDAGGNIVCDVNNGGVYNQWGRIVYTRRSTQSADWDNSAQKYKSNRTVDLLQHYIVYNLMDTSLYKRHAEVMKRDTNIYNSDFNLAISRENSERNIEEMFSDQKLFTLRYCSGVDRPYYNPSWDYITLPHIETVSYNIETYYYMLFHEIIHSTGYRLKLNRPGVTIENIYGLHWLDGAEDLIADMGACELLTLYGFDADNVNWNYVMDGVSISDYASKWGYRFNHNPLELIYACGEAYRATCYVIFKTDMFKIDNDKLNSKGGDNCRARTSEGAITGTAMVDEHTGGFPNEIAI